MTLEEYMEKFETQEVGFQCSTKESFENLMDTLEKYGYRWSSFTSLKDGAKYWDEFKGDTWVGKGGDKWVFYGDTLNHNDYILVNYESLEPVPETYMFPNSSSTISPVITFESQEQLNELLAYWQEKLFLNDWTIKVKLVDQEELEDCQGRNDFIHSIMSSLIRISRHHEETSVTKECHEQTLVHELLHLKYNLMDADSKSYESTFLSMEEHRLLEQLAKSLIMVKYNLSFDWFKNF